MNDFDAAIDQLVKRAQEGLARRLLTAAVVLQAQAKGDYSKSNPAPHLNPAPRGQFPRGRTWNLRDSIAIQPTTIAGIIREGQTVRVGYLPAAFYGAALANRGWKGITDSYASVLGEVEKIIQGGI